MLNSDMVGQDYRVLHLGTIRRDLPAGVRPVILSYGKGLDSTWTAIQLFTSSDPYWLDLRSRVAMILTSSLGAEWPETEWHFNDVMKPFLLEHGWEVTTIVPRVKDRHGVIHENITEYYKGQAAIPTRQFRSCTDRFKINPCQHASRDLLETKDFTTILCFDAGEGKRVQRANTWKTRSYIYPPYDMGKTRPAMTLDLMELQFPVPRKSACTWCIWSKEHEMIELCEKHPEIMLDANISLEETMHEVRGRTDIKILSSGKTMRRIWEEQRSRKAMADLWWPETEEGFVIPKEVSPSASS